MICAPQVCVRVQELNSFTARTGPNVYGVLFILYTILLQKSFSNREKHEEIGFLFREETECRNTRTKCRTAETCRVRFFFVPLQTTFLIVLLVFPVSSCSVIVASRLLNVHKSLLLHASAWHADLLLGAPWHVVAITCVHPQCRSRCLGFVNYSFLKQLAVRVRRMNSCLPSQLDSGNSNSMVCASAGYLCLSFRAALNSDSIRGCCEAGIWT